MTLSNYLLDYKVNMRLEEWKVNYLTLIGRQIMDQSVISAIPAYTMQTVMLLQTITMKIEKKIKALIWGGYENRRGSNLVS